VLAGILTRFLVDLCGERDRTRARLHELHAPPPTTERPLP
jgi:hypothetical protein